MSDSGRCTERRRRGQIALPYVLLVSGIIVEVVVVGTFVAYLASTGVKSERSRARAETTATAGVEDALRRISENKELGSALSYCLSLGNGVADVRLTRSVDAPSDSYVYSINSLSVVGLSTAQVKAIVTVSRTTGAVRLQSIADVEVSLTNSCISI